MACCTICGIDREKMTSGACACPAEFSFGGTGPPQVSAPAHVAPCSSCKTLRSQLAEAREDEASIAATAARLQGDVRHLKQEIERLTRDLGRAHQEIIDDERERLARFKASPGTPSALRAFLDEVKPVLTSGMDNCKYMDETDPDACGCAFCVAVRDLLARWPK